MTPEDAIDMSIEVEMIAPDDRTPAEAALVALADDHDRLMASYALVRDQRDAERRTVADQLARILDLEREVETLAAIAALDGELASLAAEAEARWEEA